jgi:hypothetical protein
MGTLYVTASEAALHEAAIDALATEMHRPPSEIKPAYEREVAQLMEGAKVREFLSVCATRRTRETLRKPVRH